MGDGQILASKRKGRPPKSDPSISGRSPATRTGTTVRRGLRRRNVRFGGFIDCDDFMEDDFEVDEEDLSEAKLLVKRTKRKAHRGRCDDGANGISGSDREEQDEDEESEREVVKKRKVSVREVGNEMDDNDDLTEDGGGGRRKEVRCGVKARRIYSSGEVDGGSLGFRLPYSWRGVVSRVVDKWVERAAQRSESRRELNCPVNCPKKKKRTYQKEF